MFRKETKIKNVIQFSCGYNYLQLCFGVLSFSDLMLATGTVDVMP